MTPTLTTATSPSASIHARALLVWLTISTWTARKYDKKISHKVNEQYAASSDAGRYNKFLLPGDCASYKALIALAGNIRASHYSETLAWSDEGWRLLPTANYMAYNDWFRKQQREYDRALDSFIDDYPMMRARARQLLNGMYRDEDYPTAQDIRSRFQLSVAYDPVPAIGDIRVDLAADQILEIETSIARRVDDAVRIAVQDSWKRLYDVVSKVRERLAQPDAIFRDTLISNAKDVCQTLERLNVTGDPTLEKMRQRVLHDLASAVPDTLREVPDVRSKTADKAAAILKAMSAVYTPDAA